MPAMTTGVAKVSLSNPIFANYFSSTSKIIGCQRVTAGGTTGQPRASVGVAAANGVPTSYADLYMNLVSSSATDTSAYSIFWVNETDPSLLAV